MKDASFTDVIERLMDATKTRNESALAAAIGITHQAVYNAKKKGNIPTSWVYEVAKKFSVSADWLFFGNQQSIAAQSLQNDVPTPQNQDTVPAGIPVIGLASCGLAGWFNPGPLAFRLPMPLGLPATSTTFAVIAVGKSMQPAGIFQGYLLFCDSAVALDKGDTAYIEKKDGTASIKRYLCRDEKWLHLQGWLDPDEEGNQKPYNEELLLETVSKTACVTLIKLKA